MGMYDSEIIQLGVVSIAGCNDTVDYPMLNSRLLPYIEWIKANSELKTDRRFFGREEFFVALNDK